MQRLNGAIGDIAQIGLSHATVIHISNSNRDWRCPAGTKELFVKASGAGSDGDHTYTYDSGGGDGTRSDRTDRGRSESGTRFVGAGFDIRALGGKEGGRNSGGTRMLNQGANGGYGIAAPSGENSCFVVSYRTANFSNQTLAIRPDSGDRGGNDARSGAGTYVEVWAWV